MEERKFHCVKYSKCLDKVAKGNCKTFTCEGCADYEKPHLERVDEFQEELNGGRSLGDQRSEKREGQMIQEGQGKPMRPIVNAGHKCSVEGCGKDARSKGMCWMHKARADRGVDLMAPKRNVGRKPKTEVDPTTKARNVESTKKERGAYKPKAPKASDQWGDDDRVELTVAAKELLRHKRAFAILEAAGIVTKEKIAAAFALAKE